MADFQHLTTLPTSLEMIQDLEKALGKERSFQRLWDAASAWLALAHHSQENSDIARSMELFRLASRKKEAQPPFFVAYGEALLFFGSFTGDPAFVREGLALLRKAISEGEVKGWTAYAEGHKLLYELTGNREDFERADSVFQRAILAVPEQGKLWLQWGLMFLESGWRKRQISEIEAALEKFTSLKMDDCPPLLVTAHLAEGLALLGFLLDDLKLIHDGKNKMMALVKEESVYPSEVLLSWGMTELVQALYFQDASYFAAAIGAFSKGLEQDGRHLRSLHALFQAYLSWGVTLRDGGRVLDACEAIERLSMLRPHSSVHLIEWGTALLRLCQLEQDAIEQQAICEEAIDKFRKAMELGGDLEAQYQLGTSLDLLGDITGVEEYFEEAIDILTRLHCRVPHDPQVTFHLALALSHRGEIASHLEALFESERLFVELIERDSEDEEAFCHLGYTQLLLSELTMDENHPEESLRYRSLAEKHLMRACSLGSAEANYHLACLYSLSGLLNRSLDYLQRADQVEALPPEEDLEHDQWIENVRDTEGYSLFLQERRRDGR